MVASQNGTRLRAFKGDHGPVNIYHGDSKVDGCHDSTLTGVQAANFVDTYNDTADITVYGNTVQASSYYAKDGLLTQFQETKAVGKNLFDIEKQLVSNSDWNVVRYQNGIEVNELTDRYFFEKTAYRIYVSPSTQYTFSTIRTAVVASPQTVKESILYYDAAGVYLNESSTPSGGNGAVSVTFTTPATCAYISLRFSRVYPLDGVLTTYRYTDIQIELRAAKTAYEPYKDTVKSGLISDLSGRNFFNNPQTTTLPDRSGNGNVATFSGMGYTSTSGSDGLGGIAFDGVNDYLSINRTLSQAGFTIFINGSWIYQNKATNVFSINGWMIPNEWSFTCNLTEATNINFEWAYNTNQIKSLRSLTVDLSTLRSLAMSFVDGTLKIYRNGALVYTETLSLSGRAANLTSISTSGVYSASKWTMQNMLFYNRVLTDQEVSQNYNAGATLDVPSPSDPSPAITNLPAGDYKYTSANGIYKFTLPSELCGINTGTPAYDKIVLDTRTGTGFIERRVAKSAPISSGFTKYSTGGWVFPGVTKFYRMGLPIDMASGSWYGNGLNIVCDKLKTVATGTGHAQMSYKECIADYDTAAGLIYGGVFTKRLSADTDAGLNSYFAANPLTIYYKLKNITRTPLTFTKLASSSATEVPMAFLTSTPSLTYPAAVFDSSATGSNKIYSHARNLAELTTQHMHAGTAVFDSGYLKVTRPDAGCIDWTPLINSDVKNCLDKTKRYVLFVDVAENTFSNAGLSFAAGGGYSAFNFFGLNFSALETGVKSIVLDVSSSYTAFNTYGYFIMTNVPTGYIVGQYIKLRYSLYEQGTEPSPYEYIPYAMTVSAPVPTLRAVGGVKDSYNTKTNTLTKRVADWVDLDGGKTAIYGTTFAGYKRLAFNGVFTSYAPNSFNINSAVYKYDSTPMTRITSWANIAKDTFMSGDGTANNSLYIIAGNDDTGFNDALAPTNNETKAYFYGWKMCNADGTAPYYKSEIPYTASTWSGWNKTGATSDASGMTYTADGPSYFYTMYPGTSFKTSTKYGMLINVVTNTLTGSFQFDDNSYVAQGGGFVWNSTTGTGNKKYTFTTKSASINQTAQFTLNPQTAGATIKIKDVRIFELPAGSQIETDFTNLTADQLATKYTFNELCPKNWKKITDGTGQTATLPTATYAGYTPYKMLYELATPTTSRPTQVTVPTVYPKTYLNIGRSPEDTVAQPTMNVSVKVKDA